MNRSVLIVSNDEDISVPLWHALERAGVRAELVPADPHRALAAAADRLADSGDWAWAAIVAGSDRRSIDLIRRLRDSFPELFLLAAMASPDVATTQAVTEAGARDFLIHPFDEEQIADCLRLWGETPISPSPGRLVCFLPARAGDGASTVALHVAEAAIHERRDRGLSGRVLLVDLDFQCGDIAFRLQLSPQRSLVDALPGSSGAPGPHVPHSAASSSTATSAVRPHWRDCVCPWRQIDVLASPPQGASFPEDQLSMPNLLSTARARYPFVVCDMPPAMHTFSKVILQQADEVYVVCNPEITSLHLAQRRVDDLQHAGVERNRLRLVLNRTGSHPWIGSEEAAQSVGLPVSARLANDYTGLQAAILKSSVVARRSMLGRQFAELTCQALGLRARATAA